MKVTLLAIIILSSSFSLFAQDLNVNNVQKETKIKKKRNFDFEFSPSTTYIPNLPNVENSYSLYTYDGYATQQIDSITSIYSSNPWQTEKENISSKLLYNIGISLKFKINQKCFIRFNPYYSIYNPKNKPSLYIDDQSNEVNRPTWDTIIFFEKPNFIGIPIAIGLNLNKNLAIEFGAQYLISTSSLPNSSITFSEQNSYLVAENISLDRFLPISGSAALNYNMTPNLSFNIRCNYGVSFYLPNTIALSDIGYYTYQNQFRQYFLYLNPATKASVSNFALSAGVNFSF